MNFNSASNDNSVDDIGTDIAFKMLSALTLDSEEIKQPRRTVVPTSEQKRYLQQNIDLLSVENRRKIGGMLTMNNSGHLLVLCAEGTVIDLDAVPDYVVEQMYDLMVYKMEQRVMLV